MARPDGDLVASPKCAGDAQTASLPDTPPLPVESDHPKPPARPAGRRTSIQTRTRRDVPGSPGQNRVIGSMRSGGSVASIVGRFSSEFGACEQKAQCSKPPAPLTTLTGESTVTDILSRIKRENSPGRSDSTDQVAVGSENHTKPTDEEIPRKPATANGTELTVNAKLSAAHAPCRVTRNGDKETVAARRRAASDAGSAAPRSRKQANSGPPAWTWNSPVFSAKPRSGPSIVPIRLPCRSHQPTTTTGSRRIGAPSKLAKRIHSGSSTGSNLSSTFSELSAQPGAGGGLQRPGRRGLPPPAPGGLSRPVPSIPNRATPPGRQPTVDPAFTTAHERSLGRHVSASSNTDTATSAYKSEADDSAAGGEDSVDVVSTRGVGVRTLLARFQPTREIRIPPYQASDHGGHGSDGHARSSTSGQSCEIDSVSPSSENIDPAPDKDTIVTKTEPVVDRERRIVSPRKISIRGNLSRFVFDQSTLIMPHHAELGFNGNIAHITPFEQQDILNAFCKSIATH